MTIVKMEWQTGRKSLILWTLVLAVVLVLFISIFPTMQTEVMKNMVETKIGGLPQDMLKIFNLDSKSGPSLLEPVGYFAYVFQYVFIAACVYAAILGSKALAKEETDGTIEFLYAQPVSRRRIVLEKCLASVSMLVAFWGVTFAVSLGAILFFDNTQAEVTQIVEELSKIMIPEFFVLVFFLTVGFMLSSVLRSANQSISLSLGLVFGLYLMGIIGDLQEKMSLFKELSPMSQGGPAILLADEFALGLIGVLSGVSALCLMVTVIIYQRKDLQI